MGETGPISSPSTRRTSKVWARADEIARRLDEARTRPLDDNGHADPEPASAERAEELIREVRADRDRDRGR